MSSVIDERRAGWGGGLLGDGPQRVHRRECANESGAVADHCDQLSALLQLEQIVDCVSETMGPVEQREGYEHKQIHTCDGVRD